MFAMFGDNISEDNMITNIIPMVGNPACDKATSKKDNQLKISYKTTAAACKQVPKFLTHKCGKDHP